MIVCRCGIRRACVGSGRARARRRALKVRHDHVAPTVSSAFIILIHMPPRSNDIMSLEGFRIKDVVDQTVGLQ